MSYDTTARMRALFALTASVLASSAVAVVVEVEVFQTGGFYDGGTKDNSPTFQNYFVGYGTSPGSTRTPERRSFFWFKLETIPDGEIVSATLSLELPFGGLIFGLGPGTPPPAPPSDPFEEFSLCAVPFSGTSVTDPTLTLGAADAMFEAFNDVPIADPSVFILAGPPPPPVIDIPIGALGLSFLNSLAMPEIVLTGWMPTWTEDLRPGVGGDPFLEAHELVFGLTDVHTGAVAKPKLTLEIVPVPEPGTFVSLAALCGLSYLRCRVAARRTLPRSKTQP